VQAIAATVWHALVVGTIEGISELSKQWATWAAQVQLIWNDIKAGAKKAWNWIRKLFDEEFDADAANRLIESAQKQRELEILQTAHNARAAAEAERISMRDDAAREYDARLAELGAENVAAHRALDAEYAARMAENEADLAAARAEWQAAITAARAAGTGGAGEGAGPGALALPPAYGEDFEDVMGQLRDALIGAEDAVREQSARVSTAGAFVTANVLGLQAGAGTNQEIGILQNIDKNTRPLRDADALAFT